MRIARLTCSCQPGIEAATKPHVQVTPTASSSAGAPSRKMRIVLVFVECLCVFASVAIFLRTEARVRALCTQAVHRPADGGDLDEEDDADEFEPMVYLASRKGPKHQFGTSGNSTVPKTMVSANLHLNKHSIANDAMQATQSNSAPANTFTAGGRKPQEVKTSYQHSRGSSAGKGQKGEYGVGSNQTTIGIKLWRKIGFKSRTPFDVRGIVNYVRSTVGHRLTSRKPHPPNGVPSTPTATAANGHLCAPHLRPLSHTANLPSFQPVTAPTQHIVETFPRTAGRTHEAAFAVVPNGPWRAARVCSAADDQAAQAQSLQTYSSARMEKLRSTRRVEDTDRRGRSRRLMPRHSTVNAKVEAASETVPADSAQDMSQPPQTVLPPPAAVAAVQSAAKRFVKFLRMDSWESIPRTSLRDDHPTVDSRANKKRNAAAASDLLVPITEKDSAIDDVFSLWRSGYCPRKKEEMFSTVTKRDIPVSRKPSKQKSQKNCLRRFESETQRESETGTTAMETIATFREMAPILKSTMEENMSMKEQPQYPDSVDSSQMDASAEEDALDEENSSVFLTPTSSSVALSTDTTTDNLEENRFSSTDRSTGSELFKESTGNEKFTTYPMTIWVTSRLHTTAHPGERHSYACNSRVEESLKTGRTGSGSKTEPAELLNNNCRSRIVLDCPTMIKSSTENLLNSIKTNSYDTYSSEGGTLNKKEIEMDGGEVNEEFDETLTGNEYVTSPNKNHKYNQQGISLRDDKNSRDENVDFGTTRQPSSKRSMHVSLKDVQERDSEPQEIADIGSSSKPNGYKDSLENSDISSNITTARAKDDDMNPLDLENAGKDDEDKMETTSITSVSSFTASRLRENSETFPLLYIIDTGDKYESLIATYKIPTDMVSEDAFEVEINDENSIKKSTVPYNIYKNPKSINKMEHNNLFKSREEISESDIQDTSSAQLLPREDSAKINTITELLKKFTLQGDAIHGMKPTRLTTVKNKHSSNCATLNTNMQNKFSKEHHENKVSKMKLKTTRSMWDKGTSKQGAHKRVSNKRKHDKSQSKLFVNVDNKKFAQHSYNFRVPPNLSKTKNNNFLDEEKSDSSLSGNILILGELVGNEKHKTVKHVLGKARKKTLQNSGMGPFVSTEMPQVSKTDFDKGKGDAVDLKGEVEAEDTKSFVDWETSPPPGNNTEKAASFSTTNVDALWDEQDAIDLEKLQIVFTRRLPRKNRHVIEQNIKHIKVTSELPLERSHENEMYSRPCSALKMQSNKHSRGRGKIVIEINGLGNEKSLKVNERSDSNHVHGRPHIKIGGDSNKGKIKLKFLGKPKMDEESVTGMTGDSLVTLENPLYEDRIAKLSIPSTLRNSRHMLTQQSDLDDMAIVNEGVQADGSREGKADFGARKTSRMYKVAAMQQDIPSYFKVDATAAIANDDAGDASGKFRGIHDLFHDLNHRQRHKHQGTGGDEGEVGGDTGKVSRTHNVALVNQKDISSGCREGASAVLAGDNAAEASGKLRASHALFHELKLRRRHRLPGSREKTPGRYTTHSTASRIITSAPAPSASATTSEIRKLTSISSAQAISSVAADEITSISNTERSTRIIDTATTLSRATFAGVSSPAEISASTAVTPTDSSSVFDEKTLRTVTSDMHSSENLRAFKLATPPPITVKICSHTTIKACSGKTTTCQRGYLNNAEVTKYMTATKTHDSNNNIQKTTVTFPGISCTTRRTCPPITIPKTKATKLRCTQPKVTRSSKCHVTKPPKVIYVVITSLSNSEKCKLSKYMETSVTKCLERIVPTENMIHYGIGTHRQQSTTIKYKALIEDILSNHVTPNEFMKMVKDTDINDGFSLSGTTASPFNQTVALDTTASKGIGEISKASQATEHLTFDKQEIQNTHLPGNGNSSPSVITKSMAVTSLLTDSATSSNPLVTPEETTESSMTISSTSGDVSGLQASYSTVGSEQIIFVEKTPNAFALENPMVPLIPAFHMMGHFRSPSTKSDTQTHNTYASLSSVSQNVDATQCTTQVVGSNTERSTLEKLNTLSQQTHLTHQSNEELSGPHLQHLTKNPGPSLHSSHSLFEHKGTVSKFQSSILKTGTQVTLGIAKETSLHSLATNVDDRRNTGHGGYEVVTKGANVSENSSLTTHDSVKTMVYISSPSLASQNVPVTERLINIKNVSAGHSGENIPHLMKILKPHTVHSMEISQSSHIPELPTKYKQMQRTFHTSRNAFEKIMIGHHPTSITGVDTRKEESELAAFKFSRTPEDLALMGQKSTRQFPSKKSESSSFSKMGTFIISSTAKPTIYNASTRLSSSDSRLTTKQYVVKAKPTTSTIKQMALGKDEKRTSKAEVATLISTEKKKYSEVPRTDTVACVRTTQNENKEKDTAKTLPSGTTDKASAAPANIQNLVDGQKMQGNYITKKLSNFFIRNATTKAGSDSTAKRASPRKLTKTKHISTTCVQSSVTCPTSFPAPPCPTRTETIPTRACRKKPTECPTTKCHRTTPCRVPTTPAPVPDLLGDKGAATAAACDWGKLVELLDRLDEASAAQMRRTALAQWAYETNMSEETRCAEVEAAVDQARFQKGLVRAAREIMTAMEENGGVSNCCPSKEEVRAKKSEDEALRRLAAMAFAGTSALAEEKVRILEAVVSDMEEIYGGATVCSYTRRDSCGMRIDPDVAHIMTVSSDAAELAYYWRAWHDATGRRMRHLYPVFVRLMNEAAHLNEMADASLLWLAPYEEPRFKRHLKEQWQRVRALYLELHAHVRRRLRARFGPEAVGPRAPLPAHLLGPPPGQSWGRVLPLAAPFPGRALPDVGAAMRKQGWTSERLFREADDFMVSLNLSAAPASLWLRSMFSLPSDRRVMCHASAWDFFDGADMRVKACLALSLEDLAVAAHEMGHVQYFLQYAHQPMAFREAANPGFHEAVGDVLALAMTGEPHLRRLKLIPLLGKAGGGCPSTEAGSGADAGEGEGAEGCGRKCRAARELQLNALMAEALERLPLMPVALALERWRWDAFTGNVRPRSYTLHWWRLMEKYAGIGPPVPRSEEDFDPGAKYHVAAGTPYIQYFVSGILQFQLYRSMCIKAGQFDPQKPLRRPLHKCDIYGNAAVAESFKAMMRLGSSVQWPDALAEATCGEERCLDATGFLDYFAPLFEWLRAENARTGEPLGWDSEYNSKVFSTSKRKRDENSDEAIVDDDGG